MRLLARILFFLVLAFPSFGQTVGGAGWCKTSVNPNTITSLRVVNQRNMCSNVWDTLSRKMYYYDYALTVGSRWVEFVPLGPPIGAETKVEAGAGIGVSGNGTIATPYIITNTGDLSNTNEIQRLDTFAVVSGVLRASLLNDGVPFSSVTLPTADGSETKVNPGTAIDITGTGTTGSPYVVTNTADLSVTAGGTNALQIALNTSGQTPIFVKGMGQVTVTESATGDTVKIGGVGGIYGVSDTTQPAHVLTIAANSTLAFQSQGDNFGGIVPFRVVSNGTEPDIQGWYANGDSLVLSRSDTEFVLSTPSGLTVASGANLSLSGDSVTIATVGAALSTEKTYLQITPGNVVKYTEGIPLAHLNQSGATTGQVVKWNGTAWVADDLVGSTDLSYSGTSSPVTLNSSSGTGVTTTAGAGISLAATSGNLTITNTGDTNPSDDVTGSATAGQVAFWDGTTALAGENNLWWDKNNDRLGIGTASPRGRLTVSGPSGDDMLMGDREVMFLGSGIANNSIKNNHGGIKGLWIGNTDCCDALGSTFSPYLKIGGADDSEFFQRVKIPEIQITFGAASGRILQSNASGFASWVDQWTKDGAVAGLWTNTTPVTVGGTSGGKLVVRNNDANTSAAAADSYDGIVLRNHNATNNNWAAISGYSQPGAIAADIAFRVTNHTSAYGDIAFHTRSSADGSFAERLYLQSDGKFGIGNTSPSQPLHVSGNARITGAIYDSNNDPGSSGQILSSTVTGTDWVSASTLGDNWGSQAVQSTGSTLAGNGTAGAPLQVNTGGIGPPELASTTVTPGSYTNTNLTVDADGRITAASNGTAGGTNYQTFKDDGVSLTQRANADFISTATVTTALVDNGSNATEVAFNVPTDGITATQIAANAVGASELSSLGTAGTYGNATQVPVFTTDADGRVSAVTNTTITGTLSGLTATRIPFASAANALTDDALLTWNNTTKRMSVGNTGGSPAASVHIAEGSVASWEPLRAAGTVSGNMITTLSNANNAGGASNNLVDLSVGGASAGDPAYRWLINGVDTWSIGVDNSDADKMKWKKASTPSTLSNVGLTMTADATPLIGINNDAPLHPLHVIGRATATVLQGISGTPTHTFGTGAGTSPSLGTLTGATNGIDIQFTTGTAPSANANIVSITYPTAFSNTSFPVFCAANAQTATDITKFYISAVSATAFTIASNGTLSASTTYRFKINISGR